MLNSATLQLYSATINHNQCLTTVLRRGAERTEDDGKLLESRARRMNPQKTAMSQIICPLAPFRRSIFWHFITDNVKIIVTLIHCPPWPNVYVSRLVGVSI